MRPGPARSRKRLLLLSGVYCAASLTHFAHNAEFCGAYPNLPAWISQGSVYGAWIVITAIGMAGIGFVMLRYRVIGLSIVCVYAALGFAGLLHYRLAPMSAHTSGMNYSIWGEVVAGGVLLAFALRRLLAETLLKRDGAKTENA